MESQLERGEKMNVHRIKRTLQSLNIGIHFDILGKQDIGAPNRDKWMGVFYRGRHVGTLDRGIEGNAPEFNTYEMKKVPRGKPEEIDYCEHVGWRTTFEKLAVSNIPNVDWGTICRAFNIDYKRVRGHASSLKVA
ncbi:MAG: hypothetical protein DRH30_12780 [Deltaproteobacteria bacterium]|nr:MAG: hypothetical protein DRH30_12780 [Deltaproteobacteria bacterium]